MKSGRSPGVVVVSIDCVSVQCSHSLYQPHEVIPALPAYLVPGSAALQLQGFQL